MCHVGMMTEIVRQVSDGPPLDYPEEQVQCASLKLSAFVGPRPSMDR
jgi:hypothetical protein